MDIENISGIGEKKLKLFNKIGIFSLKDALLHFPRRYEDQTKLVKLNSFTPNQNVCISLEIASISNINYINPRLNLFKIIAFDEFSEIEITFFNQNYHRNSFVVGTSYVFYGQIGFSYNKYTMTSPTFVPFENFQPKLIPIYKSTHGLHQADIRKVIYKALSESTCEDLLPSSICKKYKLLPLKQALIASHYPKSFDDLKPARRRLEFEELFMYMLELKTVQSKKKYSPGTIINTTDFSSLTDLLPYELTASQQKVLSQSIADLSTGKQLNRLLQGDVGSGKTIIATILCYLVCKSDFQCAFIAPTEILAKQHYNDIKPLFEKLNLSIEILTGSTKASDKKKIKNNLINGEIDIIIGTHAVFSDDVKFKALTLVVIDEQHRFGVNQRTALLSKGICPHTLVMSATPIPRTMSLVLYGDLDISTIDEMPKGRQQIETVLLNESKRNLINSMIKSHTDAKNQVYIVCPMIDSGEDETDFKNAKEVFAQLSSVFKTEQIGLVHGKLKAKEKDAVMHEFILGNLDILVSTTVIEVGVNVPNATLIVIENAERFGLSTLHQLRGRVGRGTKKSECILVSNSNAKRLDILTKTTDGFIIAKEDMSLRGTGDYYGNRQSGASELSILDFNAKMLECASLEAELIVDTQNWDSLHPKLYQKIQTKIEKGIINMFN